MPSSWPTRCDMPDLSELPSDNSILLMFHRALAGGGPRSPESYALVANYVRIVDASLAEYHAMRAALIRYVTTPNEVIYPLYEAISHAEACITNLLRAIRIARRIRNDRSGPSLDRRIDVLSDSVADRVRDLRNEIQHLDEVLLDGTWQPPSAHCLITRDDRIELYGKEILYSELAGWIGTLHRMSSELAIYREP